MQSQKWFFKQRKSNKQRQAKIQERSKSTKNNTRKDGLNVAFCNQTKNIIANIDLKCLIIE